MNAFFSRVLLLAGLVMVAVTGCTSQSRSAPAVAAKPAQGFIPLFPKDGVPGGWHVGAWNDVSKPADGNPVWTVKDGGL
jgi:hypothetical protein